MHVHPRYKKGIRWNIATDPYRENPMLPSAIVDALSSPNPAAPVLAAALTHYGCQTGTVHVLRDGQLRLSAYVNIPQQLLPIIDTVPIGKGIAGLAAERREPVSLCNLQTDTSGQARPNAKQTGMEGTIAVPMLVDGDLRGVFGIAKATAYDWSDAEKAEILEIASELGRRIA
jgi:L-methionine (R)-S-oxide reductase